MGKKNKKRNPEDIVPPCGSCFDCANANYICEGDFLCDLNNQVVISDWEPTRDFCHCGLDQYEPV